MNPRITLLTLGVRNLEGSLAFYRDGLGFATPGIIGTQFEHGAVVFIELESGLRLALWPIESLSHDTGLALRWSGASHISLGHNVSSRAEVDAVFAQAQRAGATPVKQPADTFYGGYAGYFKDPDDYLWEIAWNPQMLPPPPRR